RHNRPWFGPKTTTLEMVPQGQLKVFAKLEEDVAEDGLALATRLYDDHGQETMTMKVTKRRTINQVPLGEEVEIVSIGPRGQAKTIMSLRNVQVEGR
ncbi:MAG: hypothetical protein AABY13_01045, partial [Nanoarchaeota archaeon]